MDYRLQDLIDIPLFQTLQDRLNEIYSFPSAIIDNDGNVLTATAWQDVCTKYHRVHPECAKECRASDRYILDHIHEANPAVTYRCPHGLVDNATPIVIGGNHLGNYFTGQFFLEPPDLEFFRGQAARYGFDAASYLDAVARVPVWPQQKLTQYLDFMKGFTEILAGIGYKNLREAEARELIAAKESALDETSVFNQQIIDSAQEGIVVYGSDLRYRVWNPFMERLTGKSAADVIGRHPLDVFPFLADVDMVARIQMALRGETAPTIDFPYSIPGIGSGWTSDTCAPLYGKDGAVVGAIATVRNITERKHAERALLESRKRFERLAQQAPVPLGLMGARGEITYVNDRFTQLFGYGLDDIPTIDHWMLLAYPDDAYRTWAIESFRQSLADAKASNADIAAKEYSVTCRDGSVRSIEISGSVLDDSVLATFTDLTDRKRQEAALLTVQKLDSLGTMAGGIAHDFNNVLTGIMGNLSLLRDRMGDGGHDAELVREAMDASTTARGLAQQLLTFASGGNPVTRVIDIGPLLRDAAGFAVRGSTARCVVDAGTQPLPVSADREQIAQVVQNLVINAVQSMPHGGTIAVRAALVELREGDVHQLPRGQYVRWTVQDEGVGVPQPYLSRIFDPYFTTKAKGRGLGLAVCHSIVTKHGGHIGVESQAGSGTLFTIHLPAVDASRMTPAAGSGTVHVGRGRVLVMDDDPQVARVLRRLLKRLGYSVEWTADGAATIEAYRQALAGPEPFRLVIMDLTIPGGMGGKEAMAHLLELDPDVTAVVSSGYGTDPVMSEWIEHGFSGVLAKPYKLDEVSRVLAEVVAGEG